MLIFHEALLKVIIRWTRAHFDTTWNFVQKKNHRWPFGWDMYCLMSSINLVSSSVNISLSHPDISRVHGTSYPGSSGSHISIAFLLRYLLIRNWFQHHSRQEPWCSLNLPANELNCSIPVHKCINKPKYKWIKWTYDALTNEGNICSFEVSVSLSFFFTCILLPLSSICSDKVRRYIVRIMAKSVFSRSFFSKFFSCLLANQWCKFLSQFSAFWGIQDIYRLSKIS